MATKSLYFDIIGRDKSASKAVDNVANGLLAFAATAGVAAGASIAKFAEFDAQMSLVQDSTRESAGTMNLLRDAALDAGARTAFSATDAAAAIDALARAGVSTADILGGGLNGALDLAAAGGLDVAKAAEIASTAMVQFGKSGADVPHIADLLAAGAGKAMGTVEDLSMALDQAGLVASQAGLSIEETTGTLAAFASAGLVGSDGGTAFKTMLQRLTPVSAQARDKMKELGISAWDAQGNFIGISEYAGVLHDALKDLSPEARNAAMAVMFGSDAVRAASVLYEQGAKGIGDWIDQTDDAGYAAESAAIKMDNLKGDTEQLSGALETLLIKQGSGANDVLRSLTQTATELVTGFANLPEPVQAAATAFTLAAVAVTGLTGAAIKIAPAIEKGRASLKRLDLTGANLAKTLGRGVGLTAILTAVAGAVSSYGNATALAADQTAKLDAIAKRGNFDQLNSEFVDAYGNVTTFKDSLDHLFTGNFWNSYSGGPQQLNGAIKALSFGMIDLGAWADTNRAKFTQLGESLAATAATDFRSATRDFGAMVDMAVEGGLEQEEAIRQLLEAFPAYKAALIDQASAYDDNLSQQELFDLALGRGEIAMRIAKDAAAENAVNLAGMADAASEAEIQISDLAEQLSNFGSTQFDANAAAREFEAAVDDAADGLQRQREEFEAANGTLDGFVATLDRGTEAGRQNEAALDAIAQSANNSAAAILNNGGSVDEATGALHRGRDALIAQLEQYGITGAAADTYVQKLLATPDQLLTAVVVSGITEQQARVDEFIRINSAKRIHIAMGVGGSGGITPYATGGAVVGPGAKGVDSVHAFLAPGEHVWTAAEVDAAGGHAAVAQMRRTTRLGAAGRVAAVGSLATTSATAGPRVAGPSRPVMQFTVPTGAASDAPAGGETTEVIQVVLPGVGVIAEAIRKRNKGL